VSVEQAPRLPSAGLLRRLGAAVYDLLPILALLIVATVPFLPFLHGRVLVAQEVGALAYLYRLVQLIVTAAFFVYFWTSRGQTIGMLAWRLRLQNTDGSLISVRTALQRLAIVFALMVVPIAAYWSIWQRWAHGPAKWLALSISLLPLALAYVWIWVDDQGRAWPDRWTGTRVVVLPKR
jgi:uncharacterized RDD family membrane protein YckC